MLPEVSGEKKVYCYLQNIDENQGIVDPYEYRETSSESSDNITIITKNENNKSSYYIPYLEKFNSTSSKNKHETVTKRTNDGCQLLKACSREQKCLQNMAVPDLYCSERRYDDDSKNNNSSSPYDFHLTSNVPPFETDIPGHEEKLSSTCVKASNFKIQILDYQVFPAASLAERVDNTNTITETAEFNRVYNRNSKCCTSTANGDSKDSYCDPDYNPDSNTTISHNDDKSSCNEEDTSNNEEEQVSEIFFC